MQILSKVPHPERILRAVNYADLVRIPTPQIDLPDKAPARYMAGSDFLHGLLSGSCDCVIAIEDGHFAGLIGYVHEGEWRICTMRIEPGFQGTGMARRMDDFFRANAPAQTRHCARAAEAPRTLH